MGFPMAKNLAQAGFRLRVYNRSVNKAKEKLPDLPQARLCNSPREATEGSQFLFSSLSNDEAVRAVTFGPEGILAELGRGELDWSALSSVSRDAAGVGCDTRVATTQGCFGNGASRGRCLSALLTGRRTTFLELAWPR
jgi:3-hydroxyisobutyrate dehydrogenase-like beta-hydroxyacid dehydrogenase